LKDTPVIKARKVEDKSSTATLYGSSGSGCSLDGNNKERVAAAPSSQIFASDNNLNGTWTKDAPCYEDNNDNHKVGEADDYFFLTLLQDAPCYKDNNHDYEVEKVDNYFFFITSSHD
jgi:hypothetical protein